ncbi:MAG TPA: ATP-binding protein [Actinomycetota bacterium]|nr:ATP-binding protein [Actinomycetota bacterium]
MSGDESTSDRVKIELAAEASSAERARRFVERALTSWKCMELVEVTVLLANELVTNSVLHANTDIRVEIRKLPTGVRVQVSDHDVAPLAPRRASLSAEGGRGLALVEGISDDWGVERWDEGKTVWFQIVE